MSLSLEHMFDACLGQWAGEGGRTGPIGYGRAAWPESLGAMSKRYDEPADVEEGVDAGIEAFWWRGRRYRVRQILSRWREAGGWWESAADTAQPWARGESKEILRVDASPDPHSVSAETSAGATSRVSAETPARTGAAGVTTATALFAARTGGHHPAGRRRVRTPVAGTYELSHDLRKGTWTLLRIWD